MFIDLHTHSTFSDGCLSPTELVRLAVHRKIRVLALTDHDTVQGLPEFLSAGKDHGLEVVPGIEISTYHGEHSLHILGYGICHTSTDLEKSLLWIQEARKLRNDKILAKLQILGIPISPQELADQGIGQIGRPHIASILVKKGIVKTAQECFVRFLRRGGAAFVEQERPEVEKVIAMIRDAGGVSFLAHPGTLDPSLKIIPDLVKNLKDLGLQGIEAYYPSHSSSANNAIRKLATDLHLLISGGTDFHGDTRSTAPLGGSTGTVRIPAEIWPPLKKHLQPELLT